MKGMQLAREYYEELGAPAIARAFPEHVDRIAAGLVGEGSECYGYDDSYSQDHDFGPGFCLWLTDETAAEIGPQLQDLYRNLPDEFKGYRREVTPEGAGRVGVFRIDRFYMRYTNCMGAPKTNLEWMNVPERFLSIATNGQIFSDREGVFSDIRQTLLNYYPEDVLRKKLAARAAVMAQAGQYNYPRCMQRGDSGAAYFSLSEFIQAAVSMLYLLNRIYMPFYKWAFRGTEQLTKLSGPAQALKELADMSTVRSPKQTQDLIESICAEVAVELNRQGFSGTTDPFLSAHVGYIMAGIKDPEIRRLHVMADCD